MKKRIVSIALIIALAMSLCLPASAAGTRTVKADITYRGISIIVNGTEITPCDEAGRPTEPFIMNSTTYLPVRAIANALGLGVEWISATSTIALTSGGEVNYGSGVPAASKATKTVDITYRGTNISLDGKAVALVNANGEAVEPFILDGTNYLPLRIVGEALGLTVQWDAATSTVTLAVDNTEKIWALSSIIMKSSESGGVYTETDELVYNYDSKGRITSFGTVDKSQELKCAYDSQGRLSAATLSAGGFLEEYTFAYNDNGELAGYYLNGELVEGYVCVKDELGRIIKEDKIMAEGDVGHFEYSYDAEGRLASSFRRYDTGDFEHIRYFYDAEGRLSCRWEFNGDGEPTEDLYIKYYLSYDEQGRLVREEQYLSGEDCVNDYRTYSYNSEDRCVFESYFDVWPQPSVYSNQASYYESTYSYDADGNLAAVDGKSYYCRDFEGKGEYQYRLDYEDTEKYEYDAEGRLVYQYDEVRGLIDEFVEFTENSWNYDAEGRLVEKIEKSSSSYGTTWQYSYDGEGRLSEEKEIGYYKGEFDYETVSKFDATGILIEKLVTNRYGVCTSAYTCELDSQGRIKTAITKSFGETLFTETRNYDSEGLCISIENVNNREGTGEMAELRYTKVAAAEQNEFLTELMMRIVYSL